MDDTELKLMCKMSTDIDKLLDENEKMKQENERLKEMLLKCDPYYMYGDCNCEFDYECRFCGSNNPEEHDKSCNYQKIKDELDK